MADYSIHIKDPSGNNLFPRNKSTNIVDEGYNKTQSAINRELYSLANSKGSSNDRAIEQLNTPSSNYSVHHGLNLLHFSDLHGDAVNLKRITDYYTTYASYIDDVLFTGDMVNYQWSDGIDFWNNNSTTKKFLVAIGNHDPLVSYDWYAKDAAACHDRYLANIANWGVVQPTSKVCSYYKDYTAYNIRLIVLDGMRWNPMKSDAAQDAWLKTTLDEALGKSYSVIVASHFFGGEGVPDNSINFDAYYDDISWIDSDAATSKLGYGYLNANVSKYIDDFMTNGGDFVCYLGGHTHADFFRRLKNYPKQLQINVANAGINDNVTKGAECYVNRAKDTNWQDLFNIVSIHPTLGILSVIRVGNDFDCIGRHMGTIVFDYKNSRVLSQY